jgi:hypothetical protein
MNHQIHPSNLCETHHKKSKKKFRIAIVEDVDDRSESLVSDNSRFSQTLLIKQQGEPELPEIKNTNKQKPKEDNQSKGKDMAMLVFNPCIMVFSQLFNIIMLPLTILTRRP